MLFEQSTPFDKTARLNAAWVDWLMGFPLRWTDPSATLTPAARHVGGVGLATLDLFTGVGGIPLGLAQWCSPVAYCEIDGHARRVLEARMADGGAPRRPRVHSIFC